MIRLVLLTIYMTSGAAVFSVIEGKGPDSEHHSKRIDKLKKNMTMRFNVSSDVINSYVEELQHLFDTVHRCKFSHDDWSYYQSLYFVGSVTTTIGKGVGFIR